MTETSDAVSNLLFENWSLSDPSKDDVFWAKSRIEAVDFAKLGKNHVVACYPLTSTVKSSSFISWQMEETVAVDVLSRDKLKRDAMRGEVYRIIHAFENGVEGYLWIYVSREANIMETPELARVTLHVTCVSWKVKP